jgi:serine/threonine protein kinase
VGVEATLDPSPLAKFCHRNRYLILDVLGQGTFGQVVKCQNLKTQEVVAVKVIKNRTAYFNQSMMEVSVLDLVWGSTRQRCACPVANPTSPAQHQTRQERRPPPAAAEGYLHPPTALVPGV